MDEMYVLREPENRFMPLEVILVTESLSCPACGATLEFLAGGDSAGHWSCPTCGLSFADADAVKEAHEKAKGKK